MGKYISDIVDIASKKLTGHTNWEWIEVDDILPAVRRPEIDSVIIFLKDPMPEEDKALLKMDKDKTKGA